MPFPKPSDVPDYVEVPATYAQPGSGTLGDGSTPSGGTPPAYAYEIPDPNPGMVAGYFTTGSFTGSEYRTQAQGGTEAKFRTHINASHVNRDDPIRNYGEPDSTHWHLFFGNRSVNAWSTYRTLRQHPASTAAGGVLNGTGYWKPAMLVPQGGKTYAKIPNLIVVYYSISMAGGNSHVVTRIPQGLRYITGVNMDDPDDLLVKAEITAANNAYGRILQYRGNGWLGWEARQNNAERTLISTTTGAGRSLHLKNADGSDPWGGLATAGGTLTAIIEGPDYWDGVNLWSPGGYKHMRHAILDTNSGLERGPDGWYRLPRLSLSVSYTHGGFADYGTWVASSDAMAAAAAGHPMLPGSSMHTDWFGGWEQETFLLWQRNGLGVDGFEAHEMSDSIISGTQRLLTTNAPDGRSPQVNLGLSLASVPESMILLPTGAGRGPVTIKHRGN